MSRTIWTPAALQREAGPWRGLVWRVVAGGPGSGLARLSDNTDEAQILEAMMSRLRPALPASAQRLHPLLAAPFRAWPYNRGSRFRRAGQRDGVFYGSQALATALAEVAFYRFLFMAEAPDARLPTGPVAMTALSVAVACVQALALDDQAFAASRAALLALDDYKESQAFADDNRAAGSDGLRYPSVRARDAGLNAALLTPTSFVEDAPDDVQAWALIATSTHVRLRSDWPERAEYQFARDQFEADPRLAALPSTGG